MPISTAPPPVLNVDYRLDPESDLDVLKIVSDPDTASYIIPHVPPLFANSGLFLVTLEYTHFTPGLRINNDDFNIRFINYGGMVFILATIPKKYHPLAEKIAEQLELSLVHGVVPFDMVTPWKLKSENTYMLKGEAYTSTEDMLLRFQHETVLCDAIIEQHDKQFDIVV